MPSPCPPLPVPIDCINFQLLSLTVSTLHVSNNSNDKSVNNSNTASTLLTTLSTFAREHINGGNLTSVDSMPSTSGVCPGVLYLLSAAHVT